jgi:hypothetical protein
VWRGEEREERIGREGIGREGWDGRDGMGRIEKTYRYETCRKENHSQVRDLKKSIQVSVPLPPKSQINNIPVS